MNYLKVENETLSIFQERNDNKSSINRKKN